MRTIRSRLTYANVVASIALFMALGSSATAALIITGRQVKDGSLTGADIRNSTLRSVDVADGGLLAKDFKAGQLPSGAAGAAGAQGAQGPQGPQGSSGTPGDQGLTGPAGTAKAYALVTKSGTLITANAKNVTSVAHPSTGLFCLTLASSVDYATTGAVVGANKDFDDTTTAGASTDKLAWAEAGSGSAGCPAGTVSVNTGYSLLNGTGGNVVANEPFFVIVP